MGGDDLASDDEYLFDAGPVHARGTAISSDDENDSPSLRSGDEGRGASLAKSAPSAKKRKGAGDAVSNDAAEDAGQLKASSSKKKRRKNDKAPTNAKNVLIHAGRGIAVDGADAQAMFLGTIYSHAIKMAEGKASGGGDTEGDDNEQQSNAFSFAPHIYATPASVNEQTRKFQHSNLAAFIKSGPLPSMKRLKNWKHPHSPMVVVVTLSARRSVELMKQLSSLKLPVAKLFAKHMSVEDQVELLKGVGNNSSGGGGGGGKKKGRHYSLAVGTPGRLLKLLRHGRDEPGSDGLGALRLKHTELIVLDCHEDSKGWTVCTLKDTSGELMELMKEGVVPELERRTGKMKLAMF